MILDLDVRITTIAAILVVFLGAWLTHRVRFLAAHNIPEPVSGGLAVVVAFFYCLFAGILVTNVAQPFFAHIEPWPGNGLTLALVGQMSLNLFLAMSMMSINATTLAGLALPLFVIVAAQVAMVCLLIAPIVFRLSGGTSTPRSCPRASSD